MGLKLFLTLDNIAVAGQNKVFSTNEERHFMFYVLMLLSKQTKRDVMKLGQEHHLASRFLYIEMFYILILLAMGYKSFE